MNKLILSLAILMAGCSPSYAQYLEASKAEAKVTTSKVVITDVISGDEVIKSYTAETELTKPFSYNLVIVTFTEEENPRWSITDSARKDAKDRWVKIDEKTWASKVEGKYWFEADVDSYGILNKETGRVDIVDHDSKLEVVVGEQPDIPVDPDVEPVTEQPIKIDGNSMLIVVESQIKPTLPPEQLAILNSETVSVYLNSVITKDQNGTPLYRVFDPNTVFANNSTSPFKAALERPREGAKPWVIISTPTGGYEGELPKNVTEMMSLLKSQFEKKE